MSPKRVVVLARPGAARERTQAAVVQAGAEVAALLDPSAAFEADVRAQDPDVLLVILDPVVEQALDRFDGVLGDPAIEVMFEDADVAARREGWEAARWARHLNAKLYGHHDVLPRGKDAPDTPAADAPRLKEEDVRFRQELDDLQARVAALPQAASPAPARPKHGAVAIDAGVGGPDAVRQLLGALPAGFARPVVLRQRIEGGQYDKLVRQMQRASALRVVLAQAGDPLQAGTVHVLPEGLDVLAAPAGLVFAPVDRAADFSALPAADSALVLLSGADASLVDRALGIALAGGVALGQSQDNCFDPAASNALVARGGHAAPIAKISHRLLERWPA
jgi:chemosensory pili system protein ChpB (putative protein-glutamate methylesterase)